MTVAALVVSLLALAVATGSLLYVHRADRRAETAGRLARLERVASIMREAADAVSSSATDPFASSRLHAARGRLEEAIGAAGVDLPKCREYAENVDARSLPAAERELERAIAAV